MLTVQLEIWPLLNKIHGLLLIEISDYYRSAMIHGTNVVEMIWITMLTLQIGNPGNIGTISCLGGGLHSLSALVRCYP